MKLLVIVGVLSLNLGCADISLTRTEKDGSKVSFHAIEWFSNSSVSKLDVDHQTDKTYQGIKVGAIENETNVESLKAVGEMMGNAIAAGVKKSLVPTP